MINGTRIQRRCRFRSTPQIEAAKRFWPERAKRALIFVRSYKEPTTDYSIRVPTAAIPPEEHLPDGRWS